jgi:uncharacterized membrane protein YfcA
MEIISITLLSVVASAVGTITGFGISTIMTPVLLHFLPLPETLLLVGIVHWFNDIWELLLFREGIRWRLLLAFGAPGIIASFIGASISLNVPKEILSRTLGGFLIIYVLFILANPHFRLPQRTSVAAVGGASYGFSAGIFGIGGAVRSLFLSTFDLPKSIYIATGGAIALAIDSTRIATYVVGGTKLEFTILSGLLVFISASLLGSVIGKKIVERIPQQKFRVVIAIFLFLAGLDLIMSS